MRSSFQVNVMLTNTDIAAYLHRNVSVVCDIVSKTLYMTFHLRPITYYNKLGSCRVNLNKFNWFLSASVSWSPVFYGEKISRRSASVFLCFFHTRMVSWTKNSPMYCELCSQDSVVKIGNLLLKIMAFV